MKLLFVWKLKVEGVFNVTLRNKLVDLLCLNGRPPSTNFVLHKIFFKPEWNNR